MMKFCTLHSHGSSIIFACVLLIFFSTASMGQCPDDNVLHPSNTLNFQCGNYQDLSIGGGQFIKFNVVPNAQYTFASFNSFWAPQLSLYNDGNGQFLTFHSSPADLNWTSNVNGTIRVVVDSSCNALPFSFTSAILSYRQFNNLTITSSNATICSGETRTLTANPPGGTFGGLGVIGNTFTAPGTTGNVTITYTLGACSVNQNITVNEKPSVNLLPAGSSHSICQGGSLLLTALATGGSGFSYQWYRNNVLVGTNTSTFNATQDGSYYVIVSNLSGCSETSSTIVLTIAPNPTVTISGNTFFCAGGNVLLTANAQAVTGSPTYQWKKDGGNVGTNSSTYIAFQTGEYSVEVTNSAGCKALSSVINVTEEPAPQVSVSGTNPTCNGFSNGTATAAPSGGTPPYQFSWNTVPNQITQTATGLGEGSYQVTVSDTNGCSAVSSAVVLTEPPALVITAIDSGDASCAGVNNGFLQVAGSVGPTPYQYSVNGSPFQPSGRFNNLSAGTYVAMVQDAHGCQATTTFILSNQTTVLLGLDSLRNVSCNGANDGYFALEALNGISPYNFTLDGIFFQNSPEFTNRAPGSYNILVRDAAGCEATLSVNVTQPPVLTATIASITSNFCSGDSTGAININITGGTPAYNFVWSNGDSTEDISNAAAGNYSVTITDANGCTTSSSASIVSPAELAITLANLTSAACHGSSTGAIDISISGGTSPFTYVWSNGNIFEDNTGVPAGNYSVTVTDKNGCTETASFTITEPADMTLTFTTTDVLCAGDNTGAISLAVAGGQPPYSFLWSNFSSLQNLIGITSGTYTVLVTDSRGCSTSGNAVVNATSDIVIIDSIVNVSCNANGDGGIFLSISGGDEPYSFIWSTGDTTNSLTGLSGGTFKVTVTDELGCSDSATYILNEPTALFVSLASINDVSCSNGHNGRIDITVGGGTLPYSFTWSTGDTTEDVNGLTQGIYFVTVSDAVGCLIIKSDTIKEPTPITVIAVGGQITCAGNADGSIDLMVSGGIAPYTFLWSNGDTAEDISNLLAGTYFFTVTDFNGCTKSGFQSISAISNISISENLTPVGCFGEGSGAIDLTITGGVSPYSFTWSNGETTEDVSGLLAGAFSVTVTDDSSCIAIKSFTITEPDRLQATALVSSTTCAGSSTGSINLTVVGGTTPYSYLWSNGATSEDLSAAGGGIFSITVTDAHGCNDSLTVTVTEPVELDLLANVINVSCNGSDDGSIFLTPNGGTPPYTYNWSNGATSQFLFDLDAGNYDVTVTDKNGCTADTAFVVGQPQLLSAALTFSNVTCNGEVDGSIDLTVAGGSSPYTYLWSNFSTTQDLLNIPAGKYTIVITDANGCIKTDTAMIVQPPAISVTSSVSNGDCFGFSQGAIDITVNGGTPGYNFNWSNGATTEDLININAGNYTVTVSDSANCSATFTFQVSEPDSLNIIAAITNVRCAGAGNGALDISVNGGTAPYTYLWSTFAVTQDISNLSGGTYTVSITDSHGCILLESFNITEPLAISTAITKTDVLCAGDANGSIDLSVNGGVAPYSYLWSNFKFTQDVLGLEGGNYAVIVTDKDGCTKTDTITIAEPQPLSITAVAKGAGCGNAAGGSVSISVSGGIPAYSYQWSNGDTTKDLLNLAPGIFTVTVTDQNGCTISNQSNVLSFPQPIVNFFADSVCFGTPVQFENNSIIASGSITSYEWDFGDSITSQLEEPVHNYASPGIYTVTLKATSVNGCENSLQQALVVSENPQAAITAEPAVSACAYDTINLFSASENSYLWSTGDTASTIKALISGDYLLTVTNTAGCFDTAHVSITVFPPVNIAVTPDTTINRGNTIKLEATGGSFYSWSPGESLDNPASSSPNARPLVNTTYSVTVTDLNGCMAVAEVTVNVDGTFIFNPPNLFTPNGDGHNETWIIRGIDVFPGCEVAVFNRWGNEIFKTKNYQNDWDGTHDGSELPDGTYYYVINCVEAGGVQKGAVTILR